MLYTSHSLCWRFNCSMHMFPSGNIEHSPLHRQVSKRCDVATPQRLQSRARAYQSARTNALDPCSRPHTLFMPTKTTSHIWTKTYQPQHSKHTYAHSHTFHANVALCLCRDQHQPATRPTTSTGLRRFVSRRQTTQHRCCDQSSSIEQTARNAIAPAQHSRALLQHERVALYLSEYVFIYVVCISGRSQIIASGIVLSECFR